MKVLLVNMPYAELGRPALGLSLLQACLARAGITCDVRYLAFALADLMGSEDYEWLSSRLPYTAFAGDWTFAAALYGDRPESDRRYVQEVLVDTWRLDASSIDRLQRARGLVSHFLSYCLAAIPWQDYAVVGFTSTFQQNLASLALAQRIKAAHPHVAIVFGGANWEGEMGIELHRHFRFVDYACSGEAENSFPALVQHILATGSAGPLRPPIPGVIFRDHGESVLCGRAAPVDDMDGQPIPDYGDFFRDLGGSGAASSLVPILLIETARGCWWGAKSPCTFCGLSGESAAFRSKSASRVLAELQHLIRRYQIPFVEAVDNVLDPVYFDELLPALAGAGEEFSLFYEVRPHLNRGQVEMLTQAGVRRVQIGFESLSDHVLKLLRKGTTALRNIQILKWAKACGLAVDWNLLYAVPGETQDDYEAMLRLLPSIRFLEAPRGTGPVRLDRFSVYFNTPAEHGISNVRPIAPYRTLYPFGDEALQRIAYYFDFDYESQVDPAWFAGQFLPQLAAWQREPAGGALRSVPGADGSLTLVDTRFPGAQRVFHLAGLEKAAYEYCDRVRPAGTVLAHLQKLFPQALVTEEGLAGFFGSLIANRLMVTDGSRYLSLAI